MDAVKVPEDYTIVGQGVDVFSNDDWGSPISNYPRVLTLLNDCESFERDPPVELLNNTLRNLGVFNTVEGVVEDDGNLLEQLLAPHLYIDDIFWDGDSPGCSGYIRTAFLSLDGTKEVCRRLAAVEKALLGWYEFSGLAAKIVLWDAERSAKAVQVGKAAGTRAAAQI